MDYRSPGSHFLPLNDSAMDGESIFSTDYGYTPWMPLSSYDQSGHLPNPAMQFYGNTTVSYPSGLVDDQMSLALDPYSNAGVTQSHPFPISGDTNDVDVQSMAPPPKSRKQKAQRLHCDKWELVKPRIIELHITQKLPLPEVKKIVEEDFKLLEFTAT
jgi:hypothetical protein